MHRLLDSFIISSISFLLLICSCGKKQQPEENTSTEPLAIGGVGKIVPMGEIRLLSIDGSGVIDSLFVKENERLKAGDTILRLRLGINEARIAVAQSKVESQRAKVLQSKVRFDEAKIIYDNKEREWDRSERLFRDGAETGQVIDDLTTGLRQQKINVESARLDYNAAVSLLKENINSLDVAREELAQRVLKAPVAGVVLDLPMNPGEYAKEGDTLVEFAPDTAVVARCEVDEMFANEVKTGQSAYILSPDTGDTLALGKVIFVADFLRKKSLFYERPGEAEDRRVREVRILPDQNMPLLLNSKVNCMLVVDRERE